MKREGNILYFIGRFDDGGRDSRTEKCRLRVKEIINRHLFRWLSGRNHSLYSSGVG